MMLLVEVAIVVVVGRDQTSDPPATTSAPSACTASANDARSVIDPSVSGYCTSAPVYVESMAAVATSPITTVRPTASARVLMAVMWCERCSGQAKKNVQ